MQFLLLYSSVCHFIIVRGHCNINTHDDYKKGQLPHFLAANYFLCEVFFDFFHSALVPFNKVSLGCSLELRADCIRASTWRFTSRPLHFYPAFSLSRCISLCILPPPFSFFSPSAQRQIAHLSLWLYSTLLSFHYPSSFSISFCPFHNNENHLFLSFSFLFLLYMGCLLERAHLVLLFSSHLIRREKRARWHFVLPYKPQLMCSNLIFSFDLVKRLYSEYMSLFKFMRSDGVLPVIGVIYTLYWGCPLSLLVTTRWPESHLEKIKSNNTALLYFGLE